MAFNIDPTAEEQNTRNIPQLSEGTKIMWICGVDFGVSQSGNKKIDVRLVCVDDMKDGTEVGAYCWDTFVLTQAAAWRIGQAARALGQTDQFDAEDPEIMDEILRRMPVKVAIQAEKYNEKTKMRPKNYTRIEGEIPEEWEDTVQRGEEWHEGGKIKRGGISAGGSTAPGGDIPF